MVTMNMWKKLLPLAGVIVIPVSLAVASGALTGENTPPQIADRPALTDRVIPTAPVSDSSRLDDDDDDNDDLEGNGLNDDGLVAPSTVAPAPIQPAPSIQYQPAPGPTYYDDDDDDDWDDDWDDDDDDWDDD